MKAEMNFDNIGGGGGTNFKYLPISLTSSYNENFHTDNYYLSFGPNGGAACSYAINGVNTDVTTDSRLEYSYDTTTQVLNITGKGSYNCYLFYNDLG